jgi:hypothetical protein
MYTHPSNRNTGACRGPRARSARCTRSTPKAAAINLSKNESQCRLTGWTVRPAVRDCLYCPDTALFNRLSSKTRGCRGCRLESIKRFGADSKEPMVCSTDTRSRKAMGHPKPPLVRTAWEWPPIYEQDHVLIQCYSQAFQRRSATAQLPTFSIPAP